MKEDMIMVGKQAASDHIHEYIPLKLIGEVSSTCTMTEASHVKSSA